RHLNIPRHSSKSKMNVLLVAFLLFSVVLIGCSAADQGEMAISNLNADTIGWTGAEMEALRVKRTFGHHKHKHHKHHKHGKHSHGGSGSGGSGSGGSGGSHGRGSGGSRGGSGGSGGGSGGSRGR
ncbi:hypothetical protein PMAYCL1PPCAC_17171, partial [Pristionchus mayeri]